MKKRLPLFWFLCLILLTSPFARGSQYSVDIGEKSISPNKHYSDQILSGDRNNLEITDNISRKIIFGTVITPVLSLKWTSDSKAIVVVEHLAGGSGAAIIGLLPDATIRFVALPFKYAFFCRVIKVEIGSPKIRICYLLSSRKRDNNWISSFQIDYTNGNISDIESRAISVDEAVKLEQEPRSAI